MFSTELQLVFALMLCLLMALQHTGKKVGMPTVYCFEVFDVDEYSGSRTEASTIKSGR